MALKQLQLKVLTPNKAVLDQAVDFVLLRTPTGDLGILPGHEAYLTQLDYSVVRAFTNKQQTEVLAVVGGFAMIQDDVVVVLSGMAEQPDKIEELIAQIEKERAENKQNEQIANLEMHRVEKALRHALVHMDISTYSIAKSHKGEEE